MTATRIALLDMGFRVFFLCAGWFSLVAVALWTLVYFGFVQLPSASVSVFQWHAHEMIYGYSLAVISGFLLTATANWTGQRTLHGLPLAALAMVWLAARVFFMLGESLVSGLLDSLFISLLSVAVIAPIVRVRQWRQIGIISKLVLFIVGALVFLLGAAGVLQEGAFLGVYGGLYLVIGLILMMGRRVVPMFIKSGVDESVEPRNSRFLDIASLILFLVFFVAVLLRIETPVAPWAALLLAVVNSLRLLGWHTQGIWRKPLVWVIYLGLWFIALGFLLFFLAHYLGWSQFLAIHAFAYGGIGLMTLGMMSRVALGHTGRNIHEPPLAIQLAFGVLALGAVVRVVLPLVSPGSYGLWIALSQGLWLVAFLLFVLVYTKILLTPRADGRTV